MDSASLSADCSQTPVQKTMEEDVQKLTDKYIKNIDAAVEEKQKEIMSV